MSTTIVIMKADAGENIIDMFKSAYFRLQHPDVNKLILEHNGKRFTITAEETEQKKEKVEIYCNNGRWTDAGVNRNGMIAVCSSEINGDYEYFFDDRGIAIYRIKLEVE